MISPAFHYPELPTGAWDNTRITLHLYLQIIGKIMLALKVRRNHWWHMTFTCTARGLATGRIPYPGGFFSMEFDFSEHQLVVTSSSHGQLSLALTDGLSVAEFHNRVFGMLDTLGAECSIIGRPFDHHCKEPFAECRTYHHYDKGYVEKFWSLLSHVAHLFEIFSAEFKGKVSPVHVFWHHMDLAVGRYNGESGPEMAADSRESDRDAYSDEVISAGFWAGDENVRGAAFYSYTYPSPPALEKVAIEPPEAAWDMSSGSPMAMLMYDDIRKDSDPDGKILAFLRSTYQAGAGTAGWDIEKYRYSPPV